MRLIFAGTPEVALPALDALAASGHELVAVVTRPDAPSGRGRSLSRSPVGAWADDRGIEVLTPARPREPQFQARLVELAPDCVPVVAYGALVPPAALAIPGHGWVNLHFSLLPAWRGAAPVQHAVLHGDEITGACVFQLEQGLDTGPVYGAVTEPIGPGDTAGDLLHRLAHSGARLLVDVLDGIAEGALAPVAQSADGVSHAPKITTEDARVRWDQPAFAVDRRIRACTPAPGAWTTFRGERIKLGPVTPLAEPGPATVATEVTAGAAEPSRVMPEGGRAPLNPGQLLVERAQVVVGTGSGPVRLGEIRAAGKRPMPATDWARGVRPDAGEQLT